MTEKERMLSETLYIPQDEELAADCARSRRLVRLINGTTEEQAEYRVQLFKELFARTKGKFMGGRKYCHQSRSHHWGQCDYWFGVRGYEGHSIRRHCGR